MKAAAIARAASGRASMGRLLGMDRRYNKGRRLIRRDGLDAIMRRRDREKCPAAATGGSGERERGGWCEVETTAGR